MRRCEWPGLSFIRSDDGNGEGGCFWGTVQGGGVFLFFWGRFSSKRPFEAVTQPDARKEHSRWKFFPGAFFRTVWGE